MTDFLEDDDWQLVDISKEPQTKLIEHTFGNLKYKPDFNERIANMILELPVVKPIIPNLYWLQLFMMYYNLMKHFHISNRALYSTIHILWVVYKNRHMLYKIFMFTRQLTFNSKV